MKFFLSQIELLVRRTPNPITDERRRGAIVELPPESIKLEIDFVLGGDSRRFDDNELIAALHTALEQLNE